MLRQMAQRCRKQFHGENKEKNAVSFPRNKKCFFMMQLAEQVRLAKFQSFLKISVSQPQEPP